MEQRATLKTGTSWINSGSLGIRQQSVSTGCGKNEYDSVGALVIHQAALHNLRQSARKGLQNARDMFKVLSEHLKGVLVINLDESKLLDFQNQK